MTIKVEKYQCPYCGDLKDIRRHAEECADSCALAERDSVAELEVEVCQLCGNHVDPAKCEEKHEGRADKMWLAHVEKLQREKLLKEGNKPNQSKLVAK